MALTSSELQLVLRNLPSSTRRAYENGQVTDDQLEKFAVSLGIKRPRADFSGVRSSSDTTEALTPPPRSLDSLSGLRATASGALDSLIGGINRSTGAGIFTGAEEGGPLGEMLLGAITDPSVTQPGGAGVGRAFAGAQGMPTTNARATGEEVFRLGGSQIEEAQDRITREVGAGRTLARGLADVAASPSSLASIPGGAFAAIPTADVYAQEYTAARLAGVPEEEARIRAAAMAGVEGGISAIPAGRFIPGLGNLGRSAVGGTASNLLLRVGKTAVGEGSEEAVTTVAQVGLDKILSDSSNSEALARYSEANLPENASAMREQVWRSFVAGAVGGAALSTPGSTMEVMADRGKAAADMLSANSRIRDDLRIAKEASARRNDQIPGAPGTQGDLFPGGPRGTIEETVPTEQPTDTQGRQTTLRTRLSALDTRIAEEESNLSTLEKDLERSRLAEEQGDRVDPFDETKIERTRNWLASARGARSRLATQLEPSQPELFGSMPQQPNATVFTGEPREGLPGPVRTRDPDIYYDVNGNRRSRTADRNRGEAAQLVVKDAEAVAKKAKKDFEKARVNARKTAVEESRTLPMDQRADFVANKLTEWDKSNTVEQFVTTTPEQRNRARRTAPTQAQVPAPDLAQQYRAANPEASDAEIASMVAQDSGPSGQMSVDQLRKNLGLSQRANGQATDTKASDVLSTLERKMGGTKAKQIGKLISDGNMVIVDDVSEIPSGAVEGGAGFYDGERTYIVANRIPKNNIMGEMLNVAAHEIKHASDIGAGENLRATMGEFIGTEANDKIVKKIQALAASGNRVAQAAVDAATRGSNPNTFNLELPAYFINASRDIRGSKGLASRVIGDVVSAVRTSYKKLKGDADINLDDVAYMSDQLIKQAAIAGEPMKGKVSEPLPLIYDESSPGYEEAKAKGWVYDSVDGTKKFVLSDSDSTLNEGAALTLLENREAKLSDIMDHPVLFEQIPEARDIQILLREQPAGGFAVYDPETKAIEVSPRLVQGQTQNVDLRAGLMHEIQHWVQDRSDRRQHFFDGENQIPEEEKTIRADYQAAARANDQAVRKLLDNSTKFIKPIRDDNTKRAATAALFDRNLSDSRKARELVAYAQDAEIPMDEQMQQLVDDVETTRLAYNAIVPIYNAAKEAAHARYLNNLTEQEAFFTQDEVNTPQENLILNPEEFFKSNRGAINGVGGQALAFTPDLLRKAISRFQQPDNKAMKIMKGQLATFGNLGRELGVMKENADGYAALHSHRAMNMFNNLNRGIRTDAKEQVKAGKYKNVDEAQTAIRKMIADRLDAIAAIENPERRESMVNAMIRSNPNLKPLADGIAEVNQLSRTILGQLIEANPNPTSDELKLMNTIYNNSFRYATQMYAAFQGPAGREHSQRLVDEYNKGRQALDKKGVVPDKYKESFRIYTNAMKYLIDNDLSIPDIDTLEGSSSDKLTNLYDTWIGDAKRTKERLKAEGITQGMSNTEADQFVRDNMVQALDDRRADITDAQVEGKAVDLINGMLDLTESSGPFASYYRGFKQDRSILEQRQGLPQEIKELFGEIRDPATRLAVTIAKQGELAGRTRMLLDMRDKGLNKWVIPPQEAGNPGNERFTAELSGENFGPLAGYRTTPEIAASITDSLEMFSTLSDAMASSYQNSEPAVQAAARAGVRGLTKLAGIQKLLTVVADMYNLGTNFLGSPIALVANGITDPRAIFSGLRTGNQVILDTLFDGRGKLSENFEDAVRYGVLDSARVQEIRRTPQKFVRSLISTESKPVQVAKEGASRAVRTGIEAFAMSDAWVKIAAFNERVNVLRNFYDAEGVERTDQQIKEEAADNIKDTNITYARTPAAVRAFEKIGVTTFMPYFVSVPRALAYNMKQGISDLIRATDAKTPAGKYHLGMAGIKRVTGSLAASAGTVAVTKAIAAAVNGDDEEKVSEMQKLMFPDARFSDSIYLGEDEEGVPLFARFSRIDPFGPANDFLRILWDEDTSPDQKRRFMVDMFKDLVITNRVLVTGSKAVIDILSDEEVKDKKTKLERVAPKATEEVKDWILKTPGLDYSDVNSVMQFVDSFTPGFVDLFDVSNKGVAKENSPEAKALGDLIVYSGGRLDRADPGLAAYQAGKKVKEARDTGRKRLAQGQAAGRSTETLEQVFLDSARDEYNALRDAADVYDGMVKGLGYTPAQASGVLKEDGSMNAADISGIRTGKILQEADQWINSSSRLLSKASLNQRNQVADKDLSAAERKQAEKEREQFLKNMKALGYKVQEK